jgi:hypothetical protein
MLLPPEEEELDDVMAAIRFLEEEMQEVHQFLKILSQNGCAKPLLTLDRVQECIRSQVGPEFEILKGDLQIKVEAAFERSGSVSKRVDQIRDEVREFKSSLGERIMAGMGIHMEALYRDTDTQLARKISDLPLASLISLEVEKKMQGLQANFPPAPPQIPDDLIQARVQQKFDALLGSPEFLGWVQGKIREAVGISANPGLPREEPGHLENSREIRKIGGTVEQIKKDFTSHLSALSQQVQGMRQLQLTSTGALDDLSRRLKRLEERPQDPPAPVRGGPTFCRLFLRWRPRIGSCENLTQGWPCSARNVTPRKLCVMRRVFRRFR